MSEKLPTADDVSEDTLELPVRDLDDRGLRALLERVAAGEEKDAEFQTSKGRVLLIHCPDQGFADEVDAFVACLHAERDIEPGKSMSAEAFFRSLPS